MADPLAGEDFSNISSLTSKTAINYFSSLVLFLRQLVHLSVQSERYKRKV